MNRRVTLIAAIVMSVSSFTLYQTELAVRRQERQLTVLDRQIAADRQAVRVLQAEWAHLSQPQRLQDLAFRHLDLAPVEGTQIGGLGDLPMRDPSALRGAGGRGVSPEYPKWPGSQEILPLPRLRPGRRDGVVLTAQSVRR